MIAIISTFRPHPGRGIRDLLRLLDAVRHGTEALVYNHPREAAASSYLAIIFGRDCQWRTLVPPLNSGANAVSHQCRRWGRPW